MPRAAVYGVSIEASSGSQNLVSLSCVSLRIAAPLKIRVLSTVRRRTLFQVAEIGWPSAASFVNMAPFFVIRTEMNDDGRIVERGPSAGT
jgi:hypothetical protein